MAACATTWAGSGRDRGMGIAEWNAELMAQQPLRRRGVRTPEFFFVRRFDNSRLVKTADPVRVREMRVFSAAVAVLFSLIMLYGLQHFSAIEAGYRVEREKQHLNQLREENRQLRLTEAQLTDPSRIDLEARRLGLMEPQPGQIIHPGSAPAEAGAPTLAQAAPPPPAVR